MKRYCLEYTNSQGQRVLSAQHYDTLDEAEEALRKTHPKWRACVIDIKEYLDREET